MSQKFCSACGRPSPYIKGMAPKNCTSCGTPFATASSLSKIIGDAAAKPTISSLVVAKPTQYSERDKKILAKRNLSQSRDEDDDTEENGGEDIDFIDDVKISVSIDKRMIAGGGIKFGDLTQQKRSELDNFDRGAGNATPASVAALLASQKRSSRENPTEIGE